MVVRRRAERRRTARHHADCIYRLRFLALLRACAPQGPRRSRKLLRAQRGAVRGQRPALGADRAGSRRARARRNAFAHRPQPGRMDRHATRFPYRRGRHADPQARARYGARDARMRAGHPLRARCCGRPSLVSVQPARAHRRGDARSRLKMVGGGLSRRQFGRRAARTLVRRMGLVARRPRSRRGRAVRRQTPRRHVFVDCRTLCRRRQRGCLRTAAARRPCYDGLARQTRDTNKRRFARARTENA